MSTPTPVTLESRVAALEAKVSADASGVVAWFKKNFPHLVTWAGLVYTAFKHL